jgi:hypothetical protein
MTWQSRWAVTAGVWQSEAGRSGSISRPDQARAASTSQRPHVTPQLIATKLTCRTLTPLFQGLVSALITGCPAIAELDLALNYIGEGRGRSDLPGDTAADLRRVAGCLLRCQTTQWAALPT